MTTYKSTILEELRWRGLLNQMTHPEDLDERLRQGPVTVYCGFDPSAASLQVGNLVGIMALAFYQRHGHRPLALVGGATGLIGDPSFKSEERVLLTRETLEGNLAGISRQLQGILGRAMQMHPDGVRSGDTFGEATPVELVNNADWMGPWSYIDFLRDVGKYFRVNAMMQKDSVRTRLEEREQGISYTEFSYMLIQAYDFLHLYEHCGCQLQVGGSDQWGNITAGTELVRRKLNQAAFGQTFPLVTSSTGEKLGKTVSGAIWLDGERTSPYSFYQYWLRTPDADVVKLLRIFTFLPQDAIEALAQGVAEGRNQGQVQQRLAWEVTALVHGADEADRAVRASQMLFGAEIVGLTDRELRSIFADVPSTQMPRQQLESGEVGIVDLLVLTGLQSSKGAARRLVDQGGVYINNLRVSEADLMVTPAHLASESMLVLRSGKKSYHVVEWL